MVFFFYLLIILGSLQGLVTMGLLLARQPSRLANTLLALVVLLIALPGIHLYGHYIGFFRKSGFPELLHASIPWISVMAIGPLFYLYVRASTDASFTIRRKYYVWFLPLVIDLFPKLMELGFYAGWFQFWTRDILADYIDVYNKYADIPRWLSFTGYVLLAGKFLAKQDGFGRIKKITGLMKVFAGIWFLFLIPYLVPALHSSFLQTVGWFPVYIPMSVLIYWIGISALYNSQEENASAAQKVPALSYPLALLEQTAQQLIAGMESARLYLDPKLDLARFSKAMGVPPKVISATVNQYLNKSFNQFLNEYRVEAFKRKLQEPGAEKLTIQGLALSCGFGSAATFQRSFKQITGITPTAFMLLKPEPAQ